MGALRPTQGEGCKKRVNRSRDQKKKTESRRVAKSREERKSFPLLGLRELKKPNSEQQAPKASKPYNNQLKTKEEGPNLKKVSKKEEKSEAPATTKRAKRRPEGKMRKRTPHFLNKLRKGRKRRRER